MIEIAVQINKMFFFLNKNWVSHHTLLSLFPHKILINQIPCTEFFQEASVCNTFLSADDYFNIHVFI